MPKNDPLTRTSDTNETIPVPKGRRTRKASPFARVFVWLFPPIYKLYMHFVLLTSKRVYYNFDHMKKLNDKGANIIGAIWHQDGLLLPFTFRNYNVITMVSKSDLGEIMAYIAERIGYIPFRGGSSMGGTQALEELIEFFCSNRRALCGIAVDGSRGPSKKVKKGIVIIAKESGSPLFGVRAWAKRKILLPTWDRMLVPLPFNEFVFFCSDPMDVPRNASAETIAAKRQELEDELMEMGTRVDAYFKNKTFKEQPGESKVVQYGTNTPLDY